MAAKLPLGLGLMAGGIILGWGGITGRLAPMIAAVFDPNLLEPAANAGGGFPLLDIAPPRGGELVPPGSGPGAVPPAGSGGALPTPVPPTAPEIGPSAGSPVIDVVPVP